MRLILMLVALLGLAACGGAAQTSRGAGVPAGEPPLYPNETPELRALINQYAAFYDVPAALIHRSIDRESDYRADARAGPYYGLMQILPQTARTMGFRGQPSELLDAETNLRWAVKYLRGAWLLSDGDYDAAIGWYARGYYYEARDRCMLVETGLRESEVRRSCG
jgi:soluble lytic murein transglycosylase-like protein